ncbi:MAG: hypothetical protein KVP17_001884 [Porospora cf. gigantea B]|uniref:uncharacterized protein n=2 Tax=Porospora cf. gigantea B TaxID=2853592 RepID=UPI003571F524|nr:MAG: hypothetical protein KVP17_001884 [Porospora cf. gigantea B]
MARVNIIPNGRSGRCMLASTFSFPSSFFPSSDCTSNPLQNELVCSQPASLLHLSAHATQRSPKLSVKDVLHEIPTNLEEVLKTTHTSPRWKQVLSEDYSETVAHLELPTLLALLNKIPPTLQEPMFIDGNVTVESVENSASACGSTQMDATLTTDGRQMYYRQRKIGAITEHLLEAEDGSRLISALYSGSDGSCFCHWLKCNSSESPLPDMSLEEAARTFLAACCCQKLPEERIQRGTVIINTGPPDVASGLAPGEWRSKVHFPRSIKHTFCRKASGEGLFASDLGAFGPFLDYPRTVIFSRLASLPGQSTTATASWSEANGLGLAVDNSRGRYMIRYPPGRVTETSVHYVGSEAPVRTSIYMPAEIDALYKHVKAGNWEAAAPLVDNIASVIDSQLQ